MKTETLIARALTRAGEGWHVFPLSRRGTPLREGWKDASTTDPEEVKRLFSMSGAARVGLHCVGRTVIDLDRKNGKDGIEFLRALYDVDPDDWETCEQTTKSGGGIHKVFNHVAAMDGMRDLGGESGVDFKSGRGKYIADYDNWNGSEIADVPADVLSLAIEYKRQRDASRRQHGEAIEVTEDARGGSKRLVEDAMLFVNGCVASHGPAIQGQGGQNRLYDVGLSLRRRFPLREDEHRRVMEHFNTQCQPPWNLSDASEARDFERQVRRAYTRESYRGEYVEPTKPVVRGPGVHGDDSIVTEQEFAATVFEKVGNVYYFGEGAASIANDTLAHLDEPGVMKSLCSGLYVERLVKVKDRLALRRTHMTIAEAGSLVDTARMHAIENVDGLRVIKQIARAPRLNAIGGEVDGWCSKGFNDSGVFMFGDPMNGLDLIDGVDEIEARLRWPFGDMRWRGVHEDGDVRQSEARYIALLLTQIASPLIDGPTPVFSIEGVGRNVGGGSGKTELASFAVMIGGGDDDASVMQWNDSIREREKAIGSIVREGQSVALLDNLPESGPIECTVLESLSTRRHAQFRVLGRSKTFRGRTPLFITTGNQVVWGGNLPRRVCAIRIGRHGKPAGEWVTGSLTFTQWLGVETNRARYVGALVSAVNAWVRAGMPRGACKMESYESWFAVVGGIMSMMPELGQHFAEGWSEHKSEGMRAAAGDAVEFFERWRSAYGDEWVNGGAIAEACLFGDTSDRTKWLHFEWFNRNDHLEDDTSRKSGHALNRAGSTAMGTFLRSNTGAPMQFEFSDGVLQLRFKRTKSERLYSIVRVQDE